MCLLLLLLYYSYISLICHEICRMFFDEYEGKPALFCNFVNFKSHLAVSLIVYVN